MEEIIEQYSETEIKKTAPALGQIVAYTGANLPDGWLPCDGRMLRRHAHPELFRALGTKYGVGDGSNTAFNLPSKVSAEARVSYIIFADMPDAYA